MPPYQVSRIGIAINLVLPERTIDSLLLINGWCSFHVGSFKVQFQDPTSPSQMHKAKTQLLPAFLCFCQDENIMRASFHLTTLNYY